LAVAGETYTMTGDYARATDYFSRAAKADPADPTRRTARAVSLIANGEIDRGVHELEVIAAEDKGARADLALIATHMQRREHDKALKAVAGLEKKQPSQPAPYNLRGAVLLAQNDIPGARRSFERA